MAELHDPHAVQHDNAPQRAVPAAPAGPGQEAPFAPVVLPANPGALLGDPRLNGRGNGPVRVAVLQRAQQTYGNRAVQRFLQRTGPAPAAEARADKGPEEVATGLGTTRLIQRQVVTPPADPAVSHDQPPPAQDDPQAGPTLQKLPRSKRSDYKPDPADPYEQPPLVWDAFTAPLPDGPPPPFTPAQFVPPEPLPYRDQAGRPWPYDAGGIKPEQREKWESVNVAFGGAYKDLGSVTAAVYPQLIAFFDVSKDLEGDLHFKLGFNTASGSNDLANQTLQQQGSGQPTVQDLFKDKTGKEGTTAQVDTAKHAMAKAHDPANQAKLAEARRQVTIANSKAHGAAEHYANVLMQAATAGEEVKQALRRINVQSLQTQEEDLQAELKQIEADKEKFAEKVELASSAIRLVASGFFAENAAGVFDDAVDFAAVATRMISGAVYDEKIDQANREIQSVHLEIKHKEAEILVIDLNLRMAEYTTAQAEIIPARRALMDTLGDAQTAYNEFAALAGALAGGGPENAKRVEAAIAAIPKVEFLLGKITDVTGGIKLPPYSDAAGIGLHANQGRVGAEFQTHVGLLKGYQEKFKKDEAVWTARLKSLEEIAAGFAPGPPKGSN